MTTGTLGRRRGGRGEGRAAPAAGAASTVEVGTPPQPVTANRAANTQTEAQAARSSAGRAMRGIVGSAAEGASYQEVRGVRTSRRALKSPRRVTALLRVTAIDRGRVG